MKIRLRLSPQNREKVLEEFTKFGIEISDEAEFVLIEEETEATFLLCKNKDEIHQIYTDEIVYIESLGRDILVHTMDMVFKSTERLYRLEQILQGDKFLRISNSIIISKNKIKKLKPTLSSKFIVTMCNGDFVDVTRTYYYKFKESFGI